MFSSSKHGFYNKRVGTYLKLIFSILVISFVFYQGKKELSSVSFREAIQVMRELSYIHLSLALLLGFLAVSTMFFYDFLLVRSQQLEIPMRKVFRVAWMANTLNGVMGFGGVIGAGLRLLIYQEHTEERGKLAQGIAWMALAMLSGLSFLSLFVLLDLFPVQGLLQAKPWLYAAVLLVVCLLPVYILSARYKGKDVASATLTLQYTLVSVLEWFSAATVATFCLYLTNGDLPIFTAYGVFVVSGVAGLLSMVPGGLGAFDVTYLIGMSGVGLDSEIILTSLLLYRIVYYFIPFIIGIVLSIYEFGSTALAKMEDKPIIGPALETSGVFFSLQKAWVVKLPYVAMIVLMLLAGFSIFVLGMVPDEGDDGSLYSLLPLGGRLVLDALLVASSLLFLVNISGIYHGTKRAYHMVFYTILLALPLVIVEAGTLLSLLWLLALLALLLGSKREFQQVRRVITLGRVTRTGLLILFFYYIYHVLLLTLDEMRAELELSIPFSQLMVVYGLSLVLFLLMLVVLYNTFERKQQDELATAVTEGELEEILNRYGGNYLSHLSFLGDKFFFIASDKQAFLQFGKISNKLIVLGDPAGAQTSFYPLLTEFYQHAARLGYEVIFYQVKAENMSMYHDFGNSFFKLGEEAIVDLACFSIAGKKQAGLRATKNRFERDGYQFEVLFPPLSDALFNQLQRVSTAWLGRKKEKGFSLGYFDRTYLERSPLGVLRNEQGQVIAFMSLMPTYQEGALSIDLMRHVPDAPSGVMDALFINLFAWAKEEGYTRFNMGMAPLANVGVTVSSFVSERIAAKIFNRVRYMYSFSGLRRFKEKYHPQWEARYMAYQKNRHLPFVIRQVTKLIGRSGGKRRG